jgi:ISXO2-like transposase domain
LFGTEGQCVAAVRVWHCPDVFVWPRSGGTEHTITGKCRLHEFHACRLQTSLKTGTIFEHTLSPLTKWFQAMRLITQSKDSIAPLATARRLNLKWDSAWLLRQNLNAVMADDEASYKLDGRIEMDDAVLGGERHEHEGGTRGRGGVNKIPFVVAVATSDEGRPQRLLLHVVKAHNGAEIEAMAVAHLAPPARIVSDELGCFRAVTRLQARAQCRSKDRLVGNNSGVQVGQHRARQRHNGHFRRVRRDPPRLRAALLR